MIKNQAKTKVSIGKPRSKPTSKPKPAAKKKAAKAALPIKTEADKYSDGVKKIFLSAGFSHIDTNGKEILFNARKSDIDNIFIYENIIVVCEETTSATDKVVTHIGKKNLLYGQIASHKQDFINYIFGFYPELKPFDIHPRNSYKVIVLYCSLYGVDSAVKSTVSSIVSFLDVTSYHYFIDLTSTIKRSSKYELFGFLGLRYDEIGPRAYGASSGGSQRYQAFILPETISNFARGYQVVTFYIAPSNLIERAFVLRRSGWKDVKILYQRPLVAKKIAKMREHLRGGKGVFINNIIATLPSNTTFSPIDNPSAVLDLNSLNRMTSVTMNLPDEFNSICIIDGQHRIFSYHESTDSTDAVEVDVARLRSVQNLLVTAICYPDTTTQEEKVNFEANLFVDINSTQTGAKSELIQEIKTIIDRYSIDAIAREVLEELNKQSPLKDKIALFFYEEVTKLKPTTIVSFGLRPLVKLSGSDSMFFLWQDAQKSVLVTAKNDTAVLERYIEFCAKEMSLFLSAFRQIVVNSGKYNWGGGVNDILTIRVINGLASCLRIIIQNGKTGDRNSYVTRFANVQDFDFAKYGGSNWRKMGQDLYKKYFS